MATWYLGIDIGTAYTKLVGLDRRGMPVLVKSLPTPTAGPDVGEAPAFDAAQLVRALEAASPQAPQQARIATCLHSRFVNAILVSLPNMPQKELAAAAVYEARRTMIPAPGPQALFEYQVLENTVDGQPKLELLVIKTERQGLEERLNPLKEAGLMPAIITPSSLALLRALSPDERRLDSLGMVHLGSRTLDVAAATRGKQRFFRSINLGCGEMSAALAAGGRMAEPEAERFLMTTGIPDASDPARQAIQPYLDRLVTEIRRSLTFYRQESEERVETLFLSGGGVLIPNLVAYLKQHIGGDLRLCDPFVELRRKEGVSLEVIADHAPLYATAFGLAQIASDPPRKGDTVNFLPAPAPWGARRLAKPAVWLRIGVGLLAALGAGWLLTEARAAALRSRLRAQQAAYATLQPALMQQQGLLARQQRLEARLGFLEGLSRSHPAIPAMLEDLARRLPEPVTLTELTISQLQAPAPAGGAGQAGSWKLLFKGMVRAHYEEALGLLERLNRSLSQSPHFSEVVVEAPNVETLQPRSIGENQVELTASREFAFAVTAAVR